MTDKVAAQRAALREVIMEVVALLGKERLRETSFFGSAKACELEVKSAA